MNRCLLWRNSPRHQIPFYVIIFKLVRLFRQLSRRLCFCWHLNHNPRGNWLVMWPGAKTTRSFQFQESNTCVHFEETLLFFGLLRCDKCALWRNSYQCGCCQQHFRYMFGNDAQLRAPSRSVTELTSAGKFGSHRCWISKEQRCRVCFVK